MEMTDKEAYIGFIGTSIIFLADLIFSFLSKGWAILLLIIMGISFLYFLVKGAVKSALKESSHNK